jgi:hypothetical protein
LTVSIFNLVGLTYSTSSTQLDSRFSTFRYAAPSRPAKQFMRLGAFSTSQKEVFSTRLKTGPGGPTGGHRQNFTKLVDEPD